MDLYQRLGIKRGASEAEVKKAYRSLAKQLHPDRNKDNPQAAKRFGEVTNAYDILSDKDKRARYDRGEIDEDGNPKSPFGSGGFGGGSAGAGGTAARRGRRVRRLPRRVRRGRRGRPQRLVRRAVRRRRRAARRRRVRRAHAGAEEGRRRRLSPEGAVHRCRDAEAAAGHARRAAGRSTSSCPRGSRTARASALPGRARPGRPGRAMRSSPSRSRRIRSMSATARTSA